MIVGKITHLLIAAAVLIAVLLIAWFFLVKNPSGPQINVNRAAVIKEMRSLNRLETASFTIEKIIDGGKTGNNVFQQFLFGDKILLIAHGQVIAGIDLSQISENDVIISGKDLRVTLPKPQILVTSLDNTQTRVYDRQKGILNTGEKNLESLARQAAEKSITKTACQAGILQQASDNARKQLTALFSIFNFSMITIEIPQGTC